MKRLLRKLFFWNAPAQGAFFGLTTFWVWSWLVFTGIYLLDHLGVLECLFNGQQLWGGICLIAVMMVLAFLPVIIRFSSLYGLCLKDTCFLRRHRYGILLASLWLLGIIFDAQGLLPMFPTLLLHVWIGVAMHPGAHKWERCALALLWGTGVLCFALIFAYGVLPFEGVIDKLSDRMSSVVHYHEFPILTPIRNGLHISGYGWSLLAFLTYLCGLLYYLLSGRILARIDNIPFRRMFRKRIIAMLGIGAATYVFFFAFAMHEERNYTQVLADLERHFGKPVAMDTLAQEYYGGRKPAPDIWKQLKTSTKSIMGKWRFSIFIDDNFYNPFEKDLFLYEWEGELYGKWQDYFREKQQETEMIQTVLSGNLPPMLRQEYEKRFFNNSWFFEDWTIAKNCLLIEAWQMRFAIDRQDAKTAQRILIYMENISKYLRYDDLQAFCIAESIRLEALIRFVESGLADASWLDGQIAYLDTLEKDLPALEKQQIYRDAVLFVNGMDNLAHHLVDSYAEGADLSKLRFFFPQIWWAEASSASVHGKAFQCDSISQMKLPEGYTDTFFTNFNYTSYYVVDTVKSLLASVRGVRTLLIAEGIRLCTGAYPETMADIPLDPFTDKPLQYSVGPCEIKQHVLSMRKAEAEDSQCCSRMPDYGCTCGCDSPEGCQCKPSGNQVVADARTEKRLVNAVQVFSPGPDTKEKHDDIRFFIRLKNQKTAQ